MCIKGMGGVPLPYKGYVEANFMIPGFVVTVTGKILQQAGHTLKQVHLSTVISKRNAMEGSDVPEYDLEGVKGKICIMKEVIIPPLVTTVVKGTVNMMTHS